MRKKPEKIRLRARFGKLVVVKRSHRDKATRRTYYLCRCDCGRETLAMAFKLINGGKKSCGCAQRTPANLGLNRSKNSWQKMLDRCLDPANHAYGNYGGRGITICERWKTFSNFYADMGDRPEGLSLGRKDNNKGYELDNCRWETTIEQHDNRRVTRWTNVFGEWETVRAVCRRLGVNIQVVHGRLKMGWSEWDAFHKPIRPKKPNRNKSPPPPF